MPRTVDVGLNQHVRSILREIGVDDLERKFKVGLITTDYEVGEAELERTFRDRPVSSVGNRRRPRSVLALRIEKIRDCNMAVVCDRVAQAADGDSWVTLGHDWHNHV